MPHLAHATATRDCKHRRSSLRRYWSYHVSVVLASHVKRALVILLSLLIACTAFAHPTGSMVVIEGRLLWSYICPVEDPDHHACVMIWDEESGIRPWVTSTFPASDWMMAPAPDGNVYLVERYFDQARQTHKVRLLTSAVNAEPQVLIPWFDDTHRFGEGGFAALGDGRFIFARYPDLYVLNLDGSASIWRKWPEPVVGLKQTHNGFFLIRGESDAWLTTRNGTVLESWSGLIQELTAEPPFMGNRVFDADHADGSLWLAYWGKRRFELIKGTNRTIIKSFDDPWLPHAIAADGRSVFLLASTITPDGGQGIRPNLWHLRDDSLELLWGESTR
jgi:hypothetical protein